MSYFCVVKIHEKYLSRCIQLAKNGLGTTYPNPLVGSVIVHNGKIIGEGWHRKAGEPHAEVNAVNSVKDQSLLKESTIYVSLEPCSHFGKTPPCCDLIIAHKIPKVVIGTIDPFSKVAGTGIQRLKDNGCEVIVGVLEKECLELNKRFFTFHNKKRPYIILKWAESRDGFIAPLTKDTKAPVWISNEYSRQLVHQWRAEEQAILVGTQTVLDDNPKLDVRDWTGKNPTRFVLDRQGKIDSNYFVNDGKTETVVITEQENLMVDDNINVEIITFDNQLSQKIVDMVYRLGLQSIIIEGGRQTLQTFIDDHLWDEARVFVSDTILEKGIPAPQLNRIGKTTKIKTDQLTIILNHD
jgi:diaminohydroxyphosphoribosylaminopyrimidine deaminase/5-amino-6-(5-phosphoribosylamino)uracil reductase